MFVQHGEDVFELPMQVASQKLSHVLGSVYHGFVEDGCEYGLPVGINFGTDIGFFFLAPTTVEVRAGVDYFLVIDHFFDDGVTDTDVTISVQ